MYPCFLQVLEILEPQKWVIFSTVLTIAVLGFSIFAAIYSYTLQNKEMAEVNLYLYSQLADISSTPEATIYKETADLWLRLFKGFEDQAKSRACYTKLFLFSLISMFVTLGFLGFMKGSWWLIPLSVSILPLFYIPIKSFGELKLLCKQPALRRQIVVEEEPTLKVRRSKNKE